MTTASGLERAPWKHHSHRTLQRVLGKHGLTLPRCPGASTASFLDPSATLPATSHYNPEFGFSVTSIKLKNKGLFKGSKSQTINIGLQYMKTQRTCLQTSSWKSAARFRRGEKVPTERHCGVWGVTWCAESLLPGTVHPPCRGHCTSLPTAT